MELVRTRSKSFTLTVGQAPVITSANSTSFTVGSAGTFTVTATGTPAATFTETGVLPTGVTLSLAGVLSGTPGAGTGGSYPITIIANNGIGTNAMQSFNLTVIVPILTSSASVPASVPAGSTATYTITNSGNASYILTCSGLPTGALCGASTVSPTSTAQLAITTTSRTSSLPPSLSKRHFRFDLWPWTLAVLGISMFAILAVRRRRAFSLIPLGTLALFIVFVAAGCGSSGGTSTGGGTTTNPNGTPAGTYKITVTGTLGSSTQTTSVILVVT